MACPFTTIAAAGGVVVGLKVLLFRDRYRRIMWLGLVSILLGWTAYALLERTTIFRIVLEAASTGLILAMVARLIWLVRVEKYRIEIPRFLSLPLRKIAPVVVHPVSLSLKAALLMMLLIGWVEIYEFTSLQYELGLGILVVWLAALFCWTHILKNKPIAEATPQESTK